MNELFQNKAYKPYLNTDNVEQRFIRCNELSNSFGWRLHEYQDNISMAIYTKEIDGFKCKINIYLTTMTVTSYMNHPKKGRGQLYRKNINYNLLEKIFRNPRQHTGKGYYTKK